MRTMTNAEKAKLQVAIWNSGPEQAKLIRASMAAAVLAECYDGSHTHPTFTDAAGQVRRLNRPSPWHKSRADTEAAYAAGDAPGHTKVIRSALSQTAHAVLRWECEVCAQLELLLRAAQWAFDAGDQETGNSLVGVALKAHRVQIPKEVVGAAGLEMTLRDIRDIARTSSLRFDLLPGWARRLL